MGKSKRNGTASGDAKLKNQIVSDNMQMVRTAESRREDDRQFAQKRWPESNEDLRKMKFYVVEFQCACEIQKGPNRPREWRPTEMAIVGFSMDRGILPSFHKLIHPGEILTAFHADCLNRTKNVLKIPHANFEMAASDYAALWKDINAMVGPDETILYCMDEHKEMARFCLHWIYTMGRQLNEKSESRLSVLTLEDCLQGLVERTGKSLSMADITDALLSGTDETGPRCKFHEELDTFNCSLATTNRWALASCKLLGKKDFIDFESTQDGKKLVADEVKAGDTRSNGHATPTGKTRRRRSIPYSEFQDMVEDPGSVKHPESTPKSQNVWATQRSPAVFSPAPSAKEKQKKPSGSRGARKEEQWPTLEQAAGKDGKATLKSPGGSATGNQTKYSSMVAGRGVGVASQELVEQPLTGKTSAENGGSPAQSSRSSPGAQTSPVTSPEGECLIRGMKGVRVHDGDDDDEAWHLVGRRRKATK